MEIIRTNIISRMVSLLTGLIFLNMSFVMVEVSVLKLDKDRQMIESIAKLIAGTNEEETDAFGGYADEDPVKEINVFFHADLSLCSLASLSSPFIKGLGEQGIPRFGNYEIYCPPPEV